MATLESIYSLKICTSRLVSPSPCAPLFQWLPSEDGPAAKTGSPADPGFTAALSRTAAAAILYIVAAHRGPQRWAEEWLEDLEVLPAAKAEKLNAVTPKRDPTELPTEKSIYPCPLVRIKFYSDTKSRRECA